MFLFLKQVFNKLFNGRAGDLIATKQRWVWNRVGGTKSLFSRLIGIKLTKKTL